MSSCFTGCVKGSGEAPGDRQNSVQPQKPDGGSVRVRDRHGDKDDTVPRDIILHL